MPYRYREFVGSDGSAFQLRREFTDLDFPDDLEHLAAYWKQHPDIETIHFHAGTQVVTIQRQSAPDLAFPTLGELRGAAPDATNGQASEDFVRQHRADDWGEDEPDGCAGRTDPGFLCAASYLRGIYADICELGCAVGRIMKSEPKP